MVRGLFGGGSATFSVLGVSENLGRMLGFLFAIGYTRLLKIIGMSNCVNVSV